MLRAEKPKDSCAETVLLPTPPLPQQTKVFQGFPPCPSLIKSVNRPTNQGFFGEGELKNSAGIPVYDSQDYQIFP